MTGMVRIVKSLIVIALVVGALAAGPVALAGDSTVLTGYGKTSDPVVQVKGTSESQPQESSTLPFTGSDLGLFVVAGAALVAVGLVGRRLGREK